MSRGFLARENRGSHVGPKGLFPCLVLILTICALFSFYVSVVDGTEGDGGDLLITGGTVIDATGRAPQARTAILIRDGVIVQLGNEEQLRKASQKPRIVDAEGRYILPGLIDSHVHYGDWGAQLYLNYGVTTVFDIGNLTEWAVAQREGVRRGTIWGPRIFTSGSHLNGPPTAPGEARAADLGGWVHFVEDGPSAKAASELLVKQGVDALKIQERLSEESLRAIVEVAKIHDIPIVGHTVNARDAALLGIRFVEHMEPIIRVTVPEGVRPAAHAMEVTRFAELIKVLVADHVYINPTVFLGHIEVSGHRDKYRAEDTILFPEFTAVPEYLKRRWLAYYERDENLEQKRLGYRNVARFLTEFVQQGGRLLSGTDSGRRLIPGLSLHREMEMLVEAGISPMEVIRATTQYPAVFFGKQEDIGTIEVGRRGDLLIVEDDPLRDISNTRKIAYVVRDGALIDRSSDAYENPIPRPVTEEVPPVLNSIEPVELAQGERGVRLVLKGEEFVIDSLVRIGDITLKPELLDDGSLQVSVPSEIVRSVGTYAVGVFNPLPGGGISNLRYVFVNFRYRYEN